MNLLLQTIPSTIISEIYVQSQFDGVVLDTEHGCFNNETLYSCIQLITQTKACFVRFTDLNKQLVRMCLDAGISGAIFSTVNDSDYGREIINYCNYPPVGYRGCGIVRENFWGNSIKPNNKPMIIAQIETKESVWQLPKILCCNFDMYIIGPYDLSSSLGCHGDWDNAKYKEYIRTISEKINQNQLGLFLPTNDIINDFHNQNQLNPKLLIYGLDTCFIKNGINDIISKYVKTGRKA